MQDLAVMVLKRLTVYGVAGMVLVSIAAYGTGCMFMESIVAYVDLAVAGLGVSLDG